MSETASISTLSGDNTFSAYVARPDGQAKAAVIVIQEIFGVNAGIRQKCDKLAANGYIAIAPDLFWRLQPGIELDPDVETEFQQALGWMGKFNQDQGVRDIQATINFAREQSRGKKVGAVGYCLGGRLAFMTAARTDIDASVGYYAVGVDGLLGEKEAIANPLMLHIPTEDGFVPAEVQKVMHDALDDHTKVTLHDYEGLDHGFATEIGQRRDETAANLADSRTSAFFAEHLA
ncbi:dienelactone hydrolase family protein [Aurantiacibacter sp. D1-12]|uniref:dienelactone hydrolase family protein n=1 Tax=Aurantiacibacter sp. D1-12 TaxID=2993658 RepID=UPI00237D324E|nr:dienelactone hydrolase family protein [Aurantiacibacter sp. D1-12]MDE1468134.1 dienelactone hydrolase family protein [Aurantiacibacter sp. D1-12]